MNIVLIILAAVSIILFIVSFFLPDPVKELTEEVEQLSIQMYQENFQLKKRIKRLEEELLIPNDLEGKQKKETGINPIIVNQVRLLNEQGLTVEQIAKQSSLSVEQVQNILQADHGGSGNE